jgi:hypothetical protein
MGVVQVWSRCFVCFVYLIEGREFAFNSIFVATSFSLAIVAPRLKSKYYMVVITIWLVATKYSFLKWQWILSFLWRFFLSSITDFASTCVHLPFLVVSMFLILLVLVLCFSSFCVLCPMFPESHHCPFVIYTSVFSIWHTGILMTFYL